LNAFAYHYGANGISMWRIWQPLKWLKEFGIDAKRNIDRSDRLQIPLEGKCHVPGVMSHQEVCDHYDIIMSTYVTNLKDRGRLICQTHYKPVVIDIDDDVTNIDKSSLDKDKWESEWKKAEMCEQIDESSDMNEAYYREKMKKHGGEIIEHTEKGEALKFYVRTGFDPVENILVLLANASGVTVSTPRLARVYSRYNDNICVIPNSYDPDVWPAKVKKDDGKIRIALFGANGHFYDWEMISGQIKQVLKENKNCVLLTNIWKINASRDQGESDTDAVGDLIMHSDFEDIPEDQIDLHHFSEIDGWHKFLAESGADIALAPLKDTLFNRAKSAVKYIEWSALGVPGVYSNMEAYQNHVIHGKTGFLAGPGEFYKYMTRLVRDETERRLMGARAKKDVTDNHHQRDASMKLANFLKETRTRYDEGKTKQYQVA